MNRWLCFVVCVLLGLGMVLGGLWVPAHLRAVDDSVIALAGRNSPTLIGQGLALANESQLGAARLFLEAAQAEQIPGREQLASTIGNLAMQNPGWQVWGGPEPRLENLAVTNRSNPGSEPVTELVIHLENRQKALDFLRGSSDSGVQELLRFRAVTNTTLFPPSQSTSGQALDTALSLCGLLLEEGRLTAGLSNTVVALASAANRGGNTQPFEAVLMDLMTLGQRFNWNQLATFVHRIDDAEALRLQANLVRNAGVRLPAFFSAVQLSGKPAAVARYLMNFNQTGLSDLGDSLQFGAGGVDELLRRNQRLHRSGFGPSLAVSYCLGMPRLALAGKWLLYLLGGFLLAASAHFARPPAPALEQPLQVRGFHVVREFLFALGFLLVVVSLSEPFLTQEYQKVEFPFRLHLPTVGRVVPAEKTGIKPTVMNPPIVLTLLLFFVLQGLLYMASVFKLAEIHRQRMPPRMKLKLLENEDHLFDAGLYLGFVGTIVSLILVSMGVIQFSLMAAYSSTSFGIVFVCVFKIFNLRPARRRLLLEAEAEAETDPAKPAATAAARPLAVHL